MAKPSSRRVEAALKAAGYRTPSYRTIHAWSKDWSKAKPAKETGPRTAKENLDDASPSLTGDPTTKAEDIVNGTKEPRFLPPPAGEKTEEQQKTDEDAARARIRSLLKAVTGDITDEQLLTMAARQTYKTAIVIEGVLAELAPTLIANNPEAVGKLQLAVAESLEAAGAPFDRVGRARELAMKTISGGQIIEPGAADPLSDALNAFRKTTAHAA
jgi:hypothetical protein